MTSQRTGFGRNVTASISVINATLAAAEDLGITRDELVSDYNEKLDAVGPQERVSVEQVGRLDQMLRSRLGRASAIRLGERMGSQNVSMLAYVLKSSRTLRDFFERICEYWPIVMDVQGPSLEVRDDHAIFGCTYADDIVRSMPATIERDFAEWLARARHVSGVDWAPREVLLQTPASDTDEYRRFFRAPVRNDAPGTWLIFDTAILDYPIREHDPHLLNVLLPIAERQRQQLSRRSSLRARVEASIKMLLVGDCPTIKTVARDLAMSARTLQRRLESEGATFATILDEIRRAEALAHLRDCTIGISEAAYRAGFSEPSTFYRAFKRWTGETPASFRRAFVN